MADSNIITLPGKVTLIVNSFTAKIKLENDLEIIGTLSGKMKLRHTQILPGDKVVVEVSTYDLTKGRIIERK
ncbi:MAG: translation initiation factor IF-1 [Mycoplasmataceae bacterium]|jgi:translation initiation factor IF-1|nr:translation initiation factor IF-1 [Mycoplasmataceae bacterium]